MFNFKGIWYIKKKSSHFPVFGILERFMSSEDFFLQFLDPGGA